MTEKEATPELEELAELLWLAGMEEDTKFPPGSDLSNLDFGELDVAGWSLAGVNLTNSDLRKVKNITRARFTEETIFQDTQLPPGVTPEKLITKT